MTGIELILTYQTIFELAAQAMNCDWRLFAGQAMQESSGEPSKIGRNGEIGLMQVKLGTAREYPGYYDVTREELLQPDMNIRVWLVHMLRLHIWLQREFQIDDIRFVFVAYNWGMGNLKLHLKAGKSFGELPPVVQLYWDEVQKWSGEFYD